MLHFRTDGPDVELPHTPSSRGLLRPSWCCLSTADNAVPLNWCTEATLPWLHLLLVSGSYFWKTVGGARHTHSLSLSLPSVYTVRHRQQGRMRGLCCWFIKLMTVRRVWETLLPCSDVDENSFMPSTSTVQNFNHAVNLSSAVIYLLCLVLVDDTDCWLCVHCLIPALSQQPLAERQEHNQDRSPIHHNIDSHSFQATTVWGCVGMHSFRLKSGQIRSLTTESNLLFAVSVFFMFFFFFFLWASRFYHTLSCCILD